ncbi:MAG: penicillin acylase family protein [Pseudomonadota bacterium]
MFEKYPLMSRFLIVIFAPICIGLLFLFFYFKSSLTATAGNLVLNGLGYPVAITHDIYGTPTIVAKTDHDAYFALGFKHASDRLWQLEVQRRLSQGRLSELFGAEMLSQDITMRNLGLYEAAKRSLPYLKKDTVDALTAYVDGINAWVAQSSSLPIEFQLFGVHPEPWSVFDSLGWHKVFSLTLSGNMMDELRRNQLQNRFTPEQINYIYSYDPIALLAKKYPPIKSHLMAKSNALIDFGIGHLFVGSNAWVVSGKHTQSGHPIIASDPHLGLQLPTMWYAASLKGDKLNVSGMTLVGLPMVIFGQNSAIAWGGTNLMSDQQDLFIETTSPQRPNQYLNGNEWKTFESHSEKINISAAFPASLHEKLASVDIVIRKTERGPVISDTQSEANAVTSLRWSALDPEDHTIDAFVDVQYAKNWSEFRQSLAQLKSPGLNFLYADREGNIGYQVAGMIPKRAEGVGILPLVASKENDWQGYHEFDLLPSVYNPEKGFIVSANEQVDHSSNIVISHEWAPEARHDRITALLQQSINAKKLMTASDMEVMQGDRLDLNALTLLPVFQQVIAGTPQEKEAIAILTEWNGEFTPGSVGATLFATWGYYLTHEIFDAALRHSWQRPAEANLLASSLERLTWGQLTKVVSTDTHGWCKPNQATVCKQELQHSLKSTLKQLEKISGTESLPKWKWSNFSRTDFIHQPLGSIKGLEWLFKRTTYSAASPNSINVSNIVFDLHKGFTQSFGAGFRQIFELDESNSHWYMLSTGESGNIMSEHFDDMIIPFSRNQLIPFGVNNPSKEILNLIPLSELQ